MELLHFASVGDVQNMEALAEEHAVTVSTQYTSMCTFHVMLSAPSGRKGPPFQAATNHARKEHVSFNSAFYQSFRPALVFLRCVIKETLCPFQVSDPTCCDYDKRTPL
jgi:hypothetical protein